MKEHCLQTIASRRSVSALKRDENLKKDELIEVIEQSLYHSPTAFNSQSSKVLVLLDEDHVAFWEAVKDRLRPLVNGSFDKTEAKINGFSNGNGTVLYFEDQMIQDELKAKIPLYANEVSLWASQSQGILQYVVWMLLTSMGLSASLQHYNPLIDDYVYTELGIERSLSLVAMMPFGLPAELPSEKFQRPIKDRVLSINKSK